MSRTKANHLKEMQVLRDLSDGVITPAAAMAMAPAVPTSSARWSSVSAEGMALRQKFIDRVIPMKITTKQLLSLHPDLQKFKKTSLANGLRTMKREISLMNGSTVDLPEGEFKSLNISCFLYCLPFLVVCLHVFWFLFLVSSFLCRKKETCQCYGR
jgi:hypothetical protein